MGMAEDPRQDAIADGRLVVAPAAAATGKMAAQPLQCGGFMLVVPQGIERRVVMFQRGAEGLDGEGENLLRQVKAAGGGESGIGDECRRTGRTVDQRAALLDLEVERVKDRQTADKAPGSRRHHLAPRPGRPAGAGHPACSRRPRRCAGWWQHGLR